MEAYCEAYTLLYLTGYRKICHSAHMWYLDATTIKLTISILAELFFPSRCNTRVTHDREYPKRHNLECCVYYFLHSWAISKSAYIFATVTSKINNGKFGLDILLDLFFRQYKLICHHT